MVINHGILIANIATIFNIATIYHQKNTFFLMTQLYPIYYGNLASQNGTLYRIEILSPDSSNIPTEVRFPADTPVEIEWQETSKLDPV